MKPIEYFSKCQSIAKKKYAMPEKELFAIIVTVEHFHAYLYGKNFTVKTDHLPLTWLWNKTNPHPRLERWMMRLSL